MLVFGVLSIGQIGAGVPAAEFGSSGVIPESLVGVVATWWSPFLVGLLVLSIGLITFTGGKWTTYRKMAEGVIDQAEMVSGVDQKACETASLQIHGWTRTMVPEENLKPYGADAPALRALGEAGKIHPQLGLTTAEVRWHAREEMARCVEDVLARRSRSLLLNARASIEAAPAVARILAEELEKDDAWVSSQTEAYTSLARGYVFGDPASVAS